MSFEAWYRFLKSNLSIMRYVAELRWPFMDRHEPVDIDLLIETAALEHLFKIASDLGYTIRGKDLQFANGAIEIRRISKIEPASGDLLSLDLLLLTPDIRSVWESRITADWEGGKLSVVSREGLIKMKRLRSSGQDLDDIERLQRGSD